MEVLVQEDFLVGVSELILRTAKANPAVLTNYIIWRVLAAFYPDRPVEPSARCVKAISSYPYPLVLAVHAFGTGFMRQVNISRPLIGQKGFIVI